MNETWREIALKKSQQCLSGRQKERKEKKIDNGIINSKDKFNFIRRHPCRKSNWIKPPNKTPTNMSATVKLITKYMLRVRRLLFFIKKRMMARRFTVTICNRTGRSAAGTRRIKGFSKAMYLKLKSISNTATKNQK